MHHVIEHDDWTVSTAPIGFGAAITAFIVVYRTRTPGTSQFAAIGLLMLIVGLAAQAILFYTSPRRIEVHDGIIIATYFGGREATLHIEALVRSERPTVMERTFGLVELRHATGGTWCRVLNDMKGWETLVGVIAATGGPR